MGKLLAPSSRSARMIPQPTGEGARLHSFVSSHTQRIVSVSVQGTASMLFSLKNSQDKDSFGPHSSNYMESVVITATDERKKGKSIFIICNILVTLDLNDNL